MGSGFLIQLCFQPWVSLTVLLLCRINHKVFEKAGECYTEHVARPPPFALKGQPSLLLFSFYFLFTLTPVRAEKDSCVIVLLVNAKDMQIPVSINFLLQRT